MMEKIFLLLQLLEKFLPNAYLFVLMLQKLAKLIRKDGLILMDQTEDEIYLNH